MKIKKYPELNALKGKMREEKYTYKLLSARSSISIEALNNKLNGYSAFDTSEIHTLIDILRISEKDIVRYFLPSRLKDAI